MGYESKWTLIVKEGDSSLIQELRAENEWAADSLTKNGDPLEDGTWYEADNDLRKFSVKHPEAVFLLLYQGEDGEQGGNYYQNGKSHDAGVKVIHGDFDPLKLT